MIRKEKIESNLRGFLLFLEGSLAVLVDCCRAVVKSKTLNMAVDAAVENNQQTVVWEKADFMGIIK